MLSGYACFILWWEQQHKPEPVKLAVAFAVSLAAALVIDFVRDLMRHGEVEVFERPRASRIVSLLLTAAMFEIFVLAYDGVVELDAAKLHQLREELLGVFDESALYVVRDLVILAALWLLTGAVVGWMLVSVVFSAGRRALSARSLRCARRTRSQARSARRCSCSPTSCPCGPTSPSGSCSPNRRSGRPT